MKFNCHYCRNTGWEWVKDEFGGVEQTHCIWCNSHKTEVHMTEKTLPTPYCQDDLALESARLSKRITDKGYHSPEVMFHVPGYSNAKAMLHISGRTAKGYEGDKWQDFLHDKTEGVEIDIDALIVLADAAIDELQSPVDKRADNFRASLGRLLDEAREIGMEVAAIEAVVNPLTEMMNTLSENIIEHQPIAAE